MSERVGPVEVPRFAARARTVVRALGVLYVLAWLVRGVLELSNLIFYTSFFRGDSTIWSSVVFWGFVGVGVVCGLVWLVGEAMAGYGEPKDQVD